MIEFNIKECFVCDFCRNVCKGPCDKHLIDAENGIITDENRDIVGRKNRIKCLGRFCPNPCEHQDLTQYEGVDLTPFLSEIKYLGQKVNDMIEENKKIV